MTTKVSTNVVGFISSPITWTSTDDCVILEQCRKITQRTQPIYGFTITVVIGDESDIIGYTNSPVEWKSERCHSEQLIKIRQHQSIDDGFVYPLSLKYPSTTKIVLYWSWTHEHEYYDFRHAQDFFY